MFLSMKALTPGSTHTLPGFIMTDGTGWVTHAGSKLEGYMVICEHPVIFTVPADFNAVAKMVDTIDSKLDTLATEYHREKNKLIEKKSQLLQISYGGAEVLDAGLSNQVMKDILP